MNETDVRMFKFIDDSGLYSHESLLGLLDLEKRAIKQNKQNKNGKLKLTKISEEEREKLETGDIVFARWIVQERVLTRDPLIKALTDRPRSNSFKDNNKDAMFYPSIITEKIKLYLDETELIEKRLRDWNLLEDKHLTETLIKESSDLDSM